MITVQHENIKNVSSLIVVKETNINKPLPTLTYFHGFTSSKENNLPLAYLLAEKGYRVILPDSMWHGDREQGITTAKRQLAFWEIVLQNIVELNDIKAFLDKNGLILNDRFGVAGTSMGGITTASTLTAYPWIKVAAVLMGSPNITAYAKTLIEGLKSKGDFPVSETEVNQLMEQLEHYDLSKQIDKLDHRPLLFWHGENDPVVPIDHAHTFYEHAVRHYHNSEDICFLKEVNRDHKVSRYAIMETVKWFEKHL